MKNYSLTLLLSLKVVSGGSSINAKVVIKTAGISSATGNYIQVTGITTGTDSYHRITAVNSTKQITVAKSASESILKWSTSNRLRTLGCGCKSR